MEIKMEYASIEHVLAAIKSTSNSLDSSLPGSIGGANQLNAVDTLKEVNELFEQVLLSYKALIINNVQITKQSVEAMKETDEKISASFGPVPLR